MSLAEFINANHKVITEEWVAFARTILPWANTKSDEDLEDHVRELLAAIVMDMKSPQSDLEKSEKSKGNAVPGMLSGVGDKHALDRMDTGLSLNDLISEYRALRASVLRLWEKTQVQEQGEMTRFNETIDEILATSTARYLGVIEHTREQFLAILGHDLRNPIGAIAMGATLLTASDDVKTGEIATSILTSAERMSRMVNDLLDLTRTRLGDGIPVTLKAMDLESVCRQIISELETLRPERQIRFEFKGNLQGNWDADRLAQVVSNLVANALQYGSPDEPVSVVAQGESEEVVLKVHNEGPAISESAMKTIFAPMACHQPGGPDDDKKARSGLGLGLYIASEIVLAHAGTIGVTSSEQSGTTFTVKIPRHPVSKSAPTERV